MNNMNTIKKFLLIGLSALFLISCEIHRIDIQQGNIITQEMVDKLKLGMSKRQVKFVLGTPLLSHVFEDNRWDYIYTLRTHDGLKKNSRVSVYFQNDKLVKVDNDISPDKPNKKKVKVSHN